MELEFNTLFDKAKELHVKRHGVEPFPPSLNIAVEATLRRYQSRAGRSEALTIASDYNPKKFVVSKETMRIVEAVSAAAESIIAGTN